MAEDKLAMELQTVYSDSKQQADYYMWHDENPLAENRDGLFVYVCQDYDNDDIHGSLCCISICDGSQDVFGVTVSEAGFIGGQKYVQADDGIPIGRGREYGLVTHSGMAGVRRETSVVVGDYVVPNSRGEAQKSDGDYGYLVTALSEVNGMKYAIISLGAPSTLEKKWSDNVQDLSGRMSAAEHNIASAINVANSAYAIAQDTKESTDANIEFIGGQVNDALDRVEVVEGTVSNLNESVTSANSNAALAKTIAEGAVSSADSIRSEAVAVANEASKNVSDLIKDLEPITKWEDPDTGNAGAEYLTNYIQNGLATKTEIQTVETNVSESWSAINKNAQSIQSLVQTTKKHSVGEYSQAYGLTHEQAQSIMPVGIIHVPTANHSETYGSYTQEFLKGYWYTWSGEDWVASQSVSVIFSGEYVVGNEHCPYWVVTDQDVVYEGITYDLGDLYLYANGAWEKVASVSDSVVSRAISSIRQTANEVSAEITNVKGDVAALNIKIDENNAASVTTLASHLIGDYISLESWNENNKDVDTVYYDESTRLYWYYEDGAWTSTDKSYEAGLEGTMSVVQQQADNSGASIAQVVEAVGKDGEVNAASIVQAINDDKSNITISADHINLTGKVTFDSFDEDTKQKIEADTIDVQIWSSRGNIFKSRDVSSILTCHVFKGGVDITDTLPDSAFTWVKINNDGTQDEAWSATPYGNHTKVIQITSADVYSRAVFNCAVEI